MTEQVLRPTAHWPWLAGLTQRIRASRQRAVLAGDRERVLLCWQIGRDIDQTQSSKS